MIDESCAWHLVFRFRRHENVGRKVLRIAVDQGGLGALNLHHHAVAGQVGGQSRHVVPVLQAQDGSFVGKVSFENQPNPGMVTAPRLGRFYNGLSMFSR